MSDLTDYKRVTEERNNYFKKQYEQYGGFCPICSEALEPVLNEDYETFGLCKYNGKHPVDSLDTKKEEGK